MSGCFTLDSAWKLTMREPLVHPCYCRVAFPGGHCTLRLSVHLAKAVRMASPFLVAREAAGNVLECGCEHRFCVSQVNSKGGMGPSSVVVLRLWGSMTGVLRGTARPRGTCTRLLPEEKHVCSFRAYSAHSLAAVVIPALQASRYMPDICVIRAIQKIIWASGCGALQLVFSPNEEITKIYEKVRANTESLSLQ